MTGTCARSDCAMAMMLLLTPLQGQCVGQHAVPGNRQCIGSVPSRSPQIVRGLPCRAMFIWSAACRAQTRAEVFETVSAALGPRLKRIPDGETGERADWITWLEPVFANSPALEKSDEVFRLHADGDAAHPLPAQARPFGQRRDVRQSVLCRHRRAVVSGFREAQGARGKFPPHCRFQIDLVPAHSVIWLYLQDELHAPLDPVYNAAAEARDRQDRGTPAARPDSRSSSTWRRRCSHGWSATTSAATAAPRTRCRQTFGRILIDLANHVPDDIELLFHFCYGDSNHKHVVEPTDMARHGGDGEPADGRHRTADPADPHAGAARPLRRCLFRAAEESQAHGRTRSCASGSCITPMVWPARASGSPRRRNSCTDFSIATECGFGRRRPDTIPELLRIHAEVAG